MDTVNKTGIPSGIIVMLLFAVGAIALMSLSLPQQLNANSDTVEVAEIKEGQIIDLTHLPQNLILPNSAELKNVGISTLGGVEIISAEYISTEENPPIKLTWLDSSGNQVGYSSHSVLNKPLYYGFHDGASGVIKIWPHLGAQKVKIEIWKE